MRHTRNYGDYPQTAQQPRDTPTSRKKNQLSRPGTLRRRYDQYTQRTVFAPSRPNKRSREEIAEIDAEIMRRANHRHGGGYQPMIEEQDEPRKITGRRRAGN